MPIVRDGVEHDVELVIRLEILQPRLTIEELDALRIDAEAIDRPPARGTRRKTQNQPRSRHCVENP